MAVYLYVDRAANVEKFVTNDREKKNTSEKNPAGINLIYGIYKNLMLQFPL